MRKSVFDFIIEKKFKYTDMFTWTLNAPVYVLSIETGQNSGDLHTHTQKEEKNIKTSCVSKDQN